MSSKSSSISLFSNSVMGGGYYLLYTFSQSKFSKKGSLFKASLSYAPNLVFGFLSSNPFNVKFSN